MSEISKQAWKLYKIRAGLKISLTAFYVFILSLVLFLGFITIYSFILTIPFIVLPFTFSYISIIASSNLKVEPKISNLFKLYPLYFKNTFSGGFRAINGFFYSVLLTIGVSLVSYIIFFYAYLQFQPGFMDAFNNLRAATTTEKINEAMTALTNLECVKFATDVTSLIATYVAVFFFIRFCLINSEKFFFNLLNVNPIPMRGCNALYKRMRKIRRGEFFKEHFLGTWYLHLAFVLLLGGGTALSYLVLKLDGQTSVLCGLFMTLILMIPLIPYYFQFSACIYICSGEDYAKASIELSEIALQRMMHMANVSEEQRKEYEKMVALSKESFEKMKKENEELEKQEQEEQSKKDDQKQ